eukprot:jgi/Botrbrau1/22733/Bobra.0132s0071.1
MQVVRADAAGMRSIAATPEVDSWSLGCIAYQIFTDKPLFDETYTDEEVRKLLGGDSLLPWETETETSPFPLIPNLDAARLVQSLLRSFLPRVFMPLYLLPRAFVPSEVMPAPCRCTFLDYQVILGMSRAFLNRAEQDGHDCTPVDEANRPQAIFHAWMSECGRRLFWYRKDPAHRLDVLGVLSSAVFRGTAAERLGSRRGSRSRTGGSTGGSVKSGKSGRSNRTARSASAAHYDSEVRSGYGRE